MALHNVLHLLAATWVMCTPMIVVFKSVPGTDHLLETVLGKMMSPAS